MTLFAFDITFTSGKLQTLFFHDTDFAGAMAHVSDKARTQYGNEPRGRNFADIASIEVSTRF